MNDDFWSSLMNGTENERRRTWESLQTGITYHHVSLLRHDLLRLLRALHSETAASVRQVALESLLSACLLRDPLGGDTRHTGLARWFLKPFHSPTAVFRAIDADRRRDEDAVLELGRVLSSHEFPETVFVRIPLSDPRWRERVELTKTCCFVGRLEVFGIEAVREFGSDSTRFYFPDRARPKDLEPGTLDPLRYHRIHQRRGSRDVGPAFRSTEDGEQRTDYALVQRYFQPEEQRLVFLLAGNSTLGTLGAVNWAVSLQDQQIPLPDEHLDSHETLEALVEVSAPIVEHPGQWQPKKLRLLRLLVGNDHEWYEERRAWGPPLTDVILIRRDSRGMAVEVFANDASASPVFRQSSEIVRFIDRLYRETNGEAGRSVPGALPDPVWQKVFGTSTLRRRVHDNLPGAIEISLDPPRVNLNVPIQMMDGS